MPRRLTFGKSKRLHRRRDFQRVFEGRWSVADRYLVVYAAPNELDCVRLGVPVSRKFGNAVRRNRVKRLIREAFRLEQETLAPGFDLVCVPRVGALGDLGRYRRSIRELSDSAVRRWRRQYGASPQAVKPSGREDGNGQAPTRRLPGRGAST